MAMARSTFALDVRGLLGAEEQLALLELPPQLRRRLLNNVTKRVRSLSRQRIREQKNLDGSPFAPRKGTGNGKKKMEAGLGKLLDVTRLSANEAELGWCNALTRWVASQQHNGVSERRTAAQSNAAEPHSAGPNATEPISRSGRLSQLSRLSRFGGLSRFARFAGRLRLPSGPGALVRGVLVAAFSLYIAYYGWHTHRLYPLHDMTKPAFWNTSSEDVVAAKRAAARVPDNVLVAAAAKIGPQLLSRDRVILWDAPGDRGYPDAPWVIADIERYSWPFPSLAAQQADVEYFKLKGYQVVFQEDGYLVLHQGPPVTHVH